MARGRWQGRDFPLVGRLQYRGASGAWTDWNALFAAGSSAYVLVLPATTQRAVPTPEQFRLNATTAVEGKSYRVATNEMVALVSAQGELPKLPPLDTPFAMVERRSADNEVL